MRSLLEDVSKERFAAYTETHPEWTHTEPHTADFPSAAVAAPCRSVDIRTISAVIAWIQSLRSRSTCSPRFFVYGFMPCIERSVARAILRRFWSPNLTETVSSPGFDPEEIGRAHV